MNSRIVMGATLALPLVWFTACTPGDDSGDSGTGTTDTGMDEGGTEDTDTGTDTGEDFCFPEYPLQDGPFVLDEQDVLTEWVIEPGVHCADGPGLVDEQNPSLLHPDNDIFTVLIYRPTLADSPGDWPQDRLPVAVFTPAYVHLYWLA